jgi:hypothetical protein
MLYKGGIVGLLLFTSSLPFLRHHCCIPFALLSFFTAPLPPLLSMRVKSLAHKNQMGKSKTTNASTSWVPSEFGQTDFTKARKEGLIAEGDQVVFPSTERIPKAPSGYQEMFLAFLWRGLSFPTHEFLRGLLFVYGVQLHQLTPNSILHIACFITLYESFLGIEPHWIL